MSPTNEFDAVLMQRAMDLAHHGIGRVEPNPAVGAVIATDDGTIIGEGWHHQFGGPHAEVHALAGAGHLAKGATLYVTLEPCCHFGKTPPCSRAVIQAGIRRVVVGTVDPAPHVNGGGIQELIAAGIEVEVSVLEKDARRLIAPFIKLMTTGIPWFHAKWAMTLDGKVATRTGSSQWISNESSRSVVHALRGRMDAIIAGIGTVLADDPLLTARPAGPRTATRIVLDSDGQTPLDSQLVRTAEQAPVVIVTKPSISMPLLQAFQSAGVEVLPIAPGVDGRPSLTELAVELGRRRFTNVLIEGGARVLGSIFDQGLIDEVHAFVAPILAGGHDAPSAVGGIGRELMAEAARLKEIEIQQLDGDVYVHGRLADADESHTILDKH